VNSPRAGWAAPVLVQLRGASEGEAAASSGGVTIFVPDSAEPGSELVVTVFTDAEPSALRRRR
jgi:hypothetical protein